MSVMAARRHRRRRRVHWLADVRSRSSVPAANCIDAASPTSASATRLDNSLLASSTVENRLTGTNCYIEYWSATDLSTFKSRLKTFVIHSGFRPAASASEVATVWLYRNIIFNCPRHLRYRGRLTYLDLVPPVPDGHWATRFLHRCRSLADLLAPCQVRFILGGSSLNDARQVICGRPLVLRPDSGIQVMATVQVWRQAIVIRGLPISASRFALSRIWLAFQIFSSTPRWWPRARKQQIS